MWGQISTGDSPGIRAIPCTLANCTSCFLPGASWTAARLLLDDDDGSAGARSWRPVGRPLALISCDVGGGRPVGQRWLPVPARRRQWSSPAGWNTAELTLWPSGKGGQASTLMTNGVGRGGGSGCRIRCLRRVCKSP